MLNRVLAFVALVACGSTAIAQTDKTIDDQKVCPMMVNKEVNAESKTVEYQGVTIRMCCDTCVGRFKKYPEAYLDEKYIPQLNGMKIPERKTVQKFCPVYPDRVITEKDAWVKYEGRKVYLFNKAAVRKWQKNPAKYAKAEILPQLDLPITPEDAAEPALAGAAASASDEEEENEGENGEGKKSADAKDGSSR